MTSSEIVTIIAAIGVVIVNIIVAWRTGIKVEVAQQNTERNMELNSTKLDKIHELTNSNLTAVKADLSIANERIIKLENLLEKKEMS